MYYIGGNSESVEQDVIHFYTMAYGGGGFAISYPLAAELVKILDGCIDRYSEYYGSDQKVQSCISEIGVQITKEPGFHQVLFFYSFTCSFYIMNISFFFQIKHFFYHEHFLFCQISFFFFLII
jgi:hypothetical protein